MSTDLSTLSDTCPTYRLNQEAHYHAHYHA
jgi:hypothetical protein